MYASNMETPQEEWVASLNAKLSVLFSEISADPLVIQYVILSERSEEYRYHITIQDGVAPVQMGMSDHVDIIFSLEERIAAQIQDGSLSTEEAFLKGLMKIDGDVKLLVKAYEQIESSNL